ncbi:MAG: SMI1/KNR4 family protein [Spirochaetes bacterium]|nr:SMI1/KNR4 family protein [Spirochaetota bacterium]
MNKYETLLAKWQAILGKTKEFDPQSCMNAGEKATPEEIAEIETSLNIKLPPSFANAISHIGKTFEFSYFLNDYVLPNKLKDNFSGRINWDVSMLCSMQECMGDEYYDDEDDKDDDYIEKMKSLYQFSYVGNGDIYVFDMSADTEEKPVLYWDHETDEIFYIANSFGDYLEKITELYCAGNEIWQIEGFLDEGGLNTVTEKALFWKNWFETFTTTKLADVQDNFDKLFQFALCRKSNDEQTIAALQQFGKAQLFDKLKETLKNGEFPQEAVCEMLALHIGDFAKEWLTNIWENAQVRQTNSILSLEFDGINILPNLICYLSANCLDKDTGAKYAIRFLEQQYGSGPGLYTFACVYLKHFDAKQIIPWLQANLTTRSDWWGRLFIDVKPDWDTFLRWSELDEKYQSALVEGLYYFVTKPYKIANLPTKQELVVFLQGLKERQLLSTRKRMIDDVLGKIDCFYDTPA